MKTNAVWSLKYFALHVSPEFGFGCCNFYIHLALSEYYWCWPRPVSRGARGYFVVFPSPSARKIYALGKFVLLEALESADISRYSLALVKKLCILKIIIYTNKQIRVYWMTASTWVRLKTSVIFTGGQKQMMKPKQTYVFCDSKLYHVRLEFNNDNKTLWVSMCSENCNGTII